MNCENCGHPLIDHGDYPELECDCCSGRVWVPAKPKTTTLEEKLDEAVVRKHGPKKDPRIPIKFRAIPGFPDYMINRQGSVKHIETGRYCLFLRLTASGGVMIMIQKNGKPQHITVQELLAKAFPPTKEKN